MFTASKFYKASTSNLFKGFMQKSITNEDKNFWRNPQFKYIKIPSTNEESKRTKHPLALNIIIRRILVRIQEGRKLTS